MAASTGIRALVEQAAADPALGRTILADPQRAAELYGLTPEQVTFLEEISKEGGMEAWAATTEVTTLVLY